MADTKKDKAARTRAKNTIKRHQRECYEIALALADANKRVALLHAECAEHERRNQMLLAANSDLVNREREAKREAEQAILMTRILMAALYKEAKQGGRDMTEVRRAVFKARVAILGESKDG